MDRRFFFKTSAAGLATAMLPLGACSTPSLPPVDRSAGALAFASDGTRFEVDGNAHALRITAAGSMAVRVGKLGREPGTMNYPASVVVVDDLAYVVECGNHRVQVFDVNGASVGIIGADDLFHPQGIATNGERLFVADTRNARIVEYALDGDMVGTFGDGTLSAPRGLTMVGTNLLVADPGLRKVLEMRTDGSIVRELGEHWVLPYGVATDGTNIFVADRSTPELSVLDRRGRELEIQQLEIAPSFVTLARDGTLYVG